MQCFDRRRDRANPGAAPARVTANRGRRCARRPSGGQATDARTGGRRRSERREEGGRATLSQTFIQAIGLEHRVSVKSLTNSKHPLSGVKNSTNLRWAKGHCEEAEDEEDEGVCPSVGLWTPRGRPRCLWEIVSVSGPTATGAKTKSCFHLIGFTLTASHAAAPPRRPN